MLFYLNNWLSTAPESKPPGIPPMPRPPGPPQQRPLTSVSPQEMKTEGGAHPAARGQGADSSAPGQNKPEAPKPPPTPQRRPGINENFARELMELHTMGVDGGYTQT